MDDITVEEQKVVDELRRRTIDDVTPKMREDVSLFYRFAKARNFNLSDAESMLRKHISWRKEMQVDTILTDYEPPEVLVKYCSTSFVCFDKKGCLVRLHDCGRADLIGLTKVAKKEELAKYFAFIGQKDVDRLTHQGGNLGKPMYTVIVDFENLTYANAMSIEALQFSLYGMKIVMDNYPEVISSILVINAPFYFSLVFATVKPILPSTIIRKMRIYGTDGWKEALLEIIDAELLPAYLGGNRTDPDGNPLCETFILRGKPIPNSYYISKNRKKLSISFDAKKLTVMPLSKEEIILEVKEKNSYLEWEFEIKSRDIEFSLLFKGFDDFEPVQLIPKQRVNTSDKPVKGCYKCEKIGNYTKLYE